MAGVPVTDYSIDLVAKLPGMVIDDRDQVIESHAALETLSFGDALVSGSDGIGVQKPKRNVAAIVFTGDLITSNVVNGNVNGVAISPVTFTSTNLATMNALGAAIVATLLAQGIIATFALSNSNNTITFTVTNASVLFASFVVTLGSGQVTATYTYTTSLIFRGIARWVQKQLVADGVGGYAAGETVSTFRRGKIAVNIRGGAVTADSNAYASLATAGDEGGVTGTSTNNIGPIGPFRESTADDGVGVIELNLP